MRIVPIAIVMWLCALVSAGNEPFNSRVELNEFSAAATAKQRLQTEGGKVVAAESTPHSLAKLIAATEAKKYSNATSRAAAEAAGVLRLSQCDDCANGDTCCNGEECCSGGAFCCSNTSSCCNDTCCDSGTAGRNEEECCPDPVHGGVCCESELTFCCAPNPNHDLPSRCCPRWYVCCDGGRYGCCDPDTMTPMEDNVGYALLLEPTWIGNMEFEAATIDLKSGVMMQNTVTGFHTEQETTRTFMFDKVRGVFMLLQANFTAPTNRSNNGGDPDRTIHLYTIDPQTAATTKVKVQGAQDEVTGYHYCETLGKIVMATFSYNSTGSRNGFRYYHVDPLTGVATYKSHSLMNDTVSDWAGWFHEVSDDGLTAYRLGYGNVVRSLGWGVEVVDLSTDPATSSFILTHDPPNYSRYRSITKLSSATVRSMFPTAFPASNQSATSPTAVELPYFISLASNLNVTNFYDLGVWIWNLANTSQKPKFVASFPNAHRTPYFGPINEVLSPDGTRYAALIVQDSALGTDWDTWAVGAVDLATGNTTEMTLSPLMLAPTVSVSGFGIPTNASIWSRPKL